MEIILTIVQIVCLLAIAFYVCRWLDRSTPKPKKEVDPIELLSESEKEAAKRNMRMEKQMYNLMNYGGGSKGQIPLEDEE